jgi:beta-glucosidase
VSLGGNSELWETLATVSVVVENIGNVSGTTIVQLYLSFLEEADALVRSL